MTKSREPGEISGIPVYCRYDAAGDVEAVTANPRKKK